MFGVLVLGVTAVSGRHVLGAPETASAQYGCGFHPLDDRRITQRHHISCAQAKRILRQLKGSRRAHTVPMVCGRSRLVQGWRLKNLGRAFNVVWNSYQRGTVSFHYERVQHYGREYCRPPYGSGEEVG